MDIIEFPKWKYRGDASTGVLVEDAAAEKKLGKGWSSAPTDTAPTVDPDAAAEPLV